MKGGKGVKKREWRTVAKRRKKWKRRGREKKKNGRISPSAEKESYLRYDCNMGEEIVCRGPRKKEEARGGLEWGRKGRGIKEGCRG